MKYCANNKDIENEKRYEEYDTREKDLLDNQQPEEEREIRTLNRG